MKFAGKILLNPEMPQRRAGHSENPAIQKFTLELRGALKGEILLFGHKHLRSLPSAPAKVTALSHRCAPPANPVTLVTF